MSSILPLLLLSLSPFSDQGVLGGVEEPLSRGRHVGLPPAVQTVPGDEGGLQGLQGDGRGGTEEKRRTAEARLQGSQGTGKGNKIT